MASILSLKVNTEDLFSSLSSESEKPLDKKIEIKENRTLYLMRKGLDEILKIKDWEGMDKYYRYRLFLDLSKLNPNSYGASDIYAFNQILRNYEETWDFWYNSGLYLSGLVNNCHDNEINLDTSFFESVPKIMILK